MTTFMQMDNYTHQYNVHQPQYSENAGSGGFTLMNGPMAQSQAANHKSKLPRREIIPTRTYQESFQLFSQYADHIVGPISGHLGVKIVIPFDLNFSNCCLCNANIDTKSKNPAILSSLMGNPDDVLLLAKRQCHLFSLCDSNINNRLVCATCYNRNLNPQTRQQWQAEFGDWVPTYMHVRARSILPILQTYLYDLECGNVSHSTPALICEKLKSQIMELDIFIRRVSKLTKQSFTTCNDHEKRLNIISNLPLTMDSEIVQMQSHWFVPSKRSKSKVKSSSSQDSSYPQSNMAHSLDNMHINTTASFSIVDRQSSNFHQEHYSYYSRASNVENKVACGQSNDDHQQQHQHLTHQSPSQHQYQQHITHHSPSQHQYQQHITHHSPSHQQQEEHSSSKQSQSSWLTSSQPSHPRPYRSQSSSHSTQIDSTSRTQPIHRATLNSSNHHDSSNSHRLIHPNQHELSIQNKKLMNAVYRMIAKQPDDDNVWVDTKFVHHMINYKRMQENTDASLSGMTSNEDFSDTIDAHPIAATLSHIFTINMLEQIEQYMMQGCPIQEGDDGLCQDQLVIRSIFHLPDYAGSKIVTLHFSCNKYHLNDYDHHHIQCFPCQINIENFQVMTENTPMEI